MQDTDPAAPRPGMSGWARLALLRWINSSLAAKIITLVLGLLLVLQVASFGAIRTSLISHAREVLPDQLKTGENVLLQVLDQRAATLTDFAEVLARDWGLQEAYAAKDPATLQSALENHGARLKATAIALLDTEFKLVIYNGDPGGPLGKLLPTLGATLKAAQRTNEAASHLILVDQELHQLVLAPLRTGRTTDGWVLMGVPLKGSEITKMRDLSDKHFTLLDRPDATAPWRVRMSSLPDEAAAALAAQAWSTGDTPPGSMREVDVPLERLAARQRWLSGHDGVEQGMRYRDSGQADVMALVTASIDDAVRLSRDLQWTLLLITVTGFAAVSITSVLAARRVTNPLRELTRAAERLGGGDLRTPMRRMQRTDEVGSLAVAFERMRINVADKQAQVEKLAYWDSLTGLPNRVQFAQAVARAIDDARDTGHAVAVVMLDLDRFKHVNDVLGYGLGDLLLRSVAERLLKRVLRDDDLVARLSGDEFAVLLRRGGAEAAQSVAARITHEFEEAFVLEEHRVDMRAGIGMACSPDHATDAETLLSRAEVAMYTAKRRASGAMMYDASIDAASSQTLSLLSELRRAVADNELRLYLQPKLGLGDGEVVGAEALVRWMHPQRGMVPPVQFIPFAEQTGYIRQLTMWIFEEAARHWKALQAEGHGLKISVNLSTRDLLDQDLPQKFAALLDQHGVPPSAFCLEITESAIMDDPKRAKATLERLSRQGFALSIDDFGTGYSSLAYLKQLPVNELKIDQSFVKAMETDDDDRKIVKLVIDLAHNLKLKVVAEGVENAQVWDLLRGLGCDQAQGYHMGRPMLAGEIAAWAEAWQLRHRGSTPTNTDTSLPAILH